MHEEKARGVISINRDQRSSLSQGNQVLVEKYFAPMV
jgi:hypothetical protein